MIIHLHIEYMTSWGEQLYLHIGEKPLAGNRIADDDIPLGNDGRGNWFVKIDSNLLAGKRYHYLLVRNEEIARTEYSIGHELDSQSSSFNDDSTLRVWDRWEDIPTDRMFFEPAFTQCILRHEVPVSTGLQNMPLASFNVVCEAATLRRGQVLVMCGNCETLGNWDPYKAPILSPTMLPFWTLTLDRKGLSFPIEYKFVILDQEHGTIVDWEDCCNRFFDPGTIDDRDAVILRNLRLINPQEEWKGEGISVHITSKRRHPAWEISNVKQLRELCEWAVEKQLCCVQLLIDDPTAAFDYTAIKEEFAGKGLYIGTDVPGEGIMQQWELADGAISDDMGYWTTSQSLSAEDILCKYRFPIDTNRCTEPFITVESLKKIGMTEREIALCCRRFVDKYEKGDLGPFHLLPQYSTQKAMSSYFEHRPQPERYLCPMLLEALADVLFIADPRHKGYYHPRRNGVKTASYAALNEDLQKIYSKIHDEFFAANDGQRELKEILRIIPLKEFINN